MKKHRGYYFVHVDGKYGAPMGRVECLPHSGDAPPRLYLQRVRLDGGGYDPGGAYWGVAGPTVGHLYVAWVPAAKQLEGSPVVLFVRARSRGGAKAAVLARVPAATFYR